MGVVERPIDFHDEIGRASAFPIVVDQSKEFPFATPFVVTGSGPAGASDIGTTAIYDLAFGRIRFGLASADPVVLLVVTMAMGHFYVRALTRGDERRAG